jgi:hypothetical protein
MARVEGRRENGWRGRGRAPLFACAIAVFALSCEGDCWSSTSPVDPPDTPLPVLQPRYVLAGVNGSTLPYTVPGSSAPRVRLIADTLLFTGAATPPGESGTYVEARTVGTQQGTAAEVVTTTRSSPRVWRRGPAYAQLLLEGFEGIGSATTLTMQLANALAPTISVSAFGPMGSYTFDPR